MRLWNLTYNDPGRWAEVHAISGKPLGLLGVRSKPGGTGSPRAELVGGSGRTQRLGQRSPSSRTGCNFERTTEGAILYFRSRLGSVFGAPLMQEETSAASPACLKGAGERLTIWCGWTHPDGTPSSGSVDMRLSRSSAERMELYIRRWLVAE